MGFLLIVAGIILSLVPMAPSQDLRDDGVRREDRDHEDNASRAELDGLTYKEIARRIFEREQQTLTLLSHSQLITEGYMQSLGHSQRMGMDKDLNPGQEYVIDDKYFLARVDLRHLDDPVEKPLFARRALSRYIRTNTSVKEEIFPMGELSMFFVDLTSFDADTYKLTYEGKEKLGETHCISFSVAPTNARDSGRFVGQIWVESSSMSIVRIRGVFSGPSGFSFRQLFSEERYFHFDSWRTQVGEGFWLPTIAYFDDRHTFAADGNLECHYRGYTLLWQHQERANVIGGLADNVTAPAFAAAGTGPKPPLESDVLVRLEKDGLLATPGPVEQSLNAIIQRITTTSKVNPKDITCRVLLTTPAESFSVGNVVILSRGLLDIVPNESVLAVLIARQVAHVVLGQSNGPSRAFHDGIFELQGRSDFPGLGIQRTPDQETAADQEAVVLLNGSPYRDAIETTKMFLSQLKAASHRFPNLLRARFGTEIIPVGSSFATPQPTSSPLTPKNMLFLRNQYGVSWNGAVVSPERTGRVAEIGIQQKQAPNQMPISAQ